MDTGVRAVAGVLTVIGLAAGMVSCNADRPEAPKPGYQERCESWGGTYVQAPMNGGAGRCLNPDGQEMGFAL